MNNEEKVFKAIGNIDDKFIEEANVKKSRRGNQYKWGAMAAGLIIVIGVSTYTHFNVLSPDIPVEDSKTTGENIPPISSPMGMRKFLNYNGYRYALVEDGRVFDVTEMAIGNQLGILEVDALHEDVVFGQDFSATFALGGILYQLADYPSGFRIAVEFEDDYYIAEIVSKADDSILTPMEYLHLADLSANTVQIDVLTHFGNELLLEITDAETISLFIELFNQAGVVQFTEEDYLNRAKAQSEGKSYLLQLHQDNQAAIYMYVIPQLLSISMGDNTYQLPDEFDNSVGELFSNLKMVTPPMQ